MSITPQQIAQVEARQFAAAQDAGTAIRAIAGPGTGKSRSIEARVHWLLTQGVNPTHLFVISFTRATYRELRQRIVDYCSGTPVSHFAPVANVSTMHSLALKALSKGQLLTMFPAHPMILDEWEQRNIFDGEYVRVQRCTPTRAGEVRLAYDAFWQTLNNFHLNNVTQLEQQAFVAFHSAKTTQYACILAGEVVRLCVDNMRAQQLDPKVLLDIDHLVVDEFQDLNACDQEFIHGIAAAGAVLWVAGDDDQSIYSFRHADPSGLLNFPSAYPQSTTHHLDDCFRCTPSVLDAATKMIAVNANRIRKNLTSLYQQAAPPVAGHVETWLCPDGPTEANVIAQSCASLISAGIAGKDLLILIANRRVQLAPIEAALSQAGVAYVAPRGPALAETDMGRVLLALLRVSSDVDDYVAHRTLLQMLRGVGTGTCLSIATAAGSNQLNFRDLFYMSALPPSVFSARCANAVRALAPICQGLGAWQPTDLLRDRTTDIESAIAAVLDHSTAPGQAAIQQWRALRATLPDDMRLDELLHFTWSESEVEQLQILQDVQTRLAVPVAGAPAISDRVRVMTMHGSKGLSGKVVFIPGAEQELNPGAMGVASPGALEERRRLMYVSVTRACARCFLSRARRRAGAQSQAMGRGFNYFPAPSQFILELQVPTVQRDSGLSTQEIQSVVADCVNL